MPRPLDPGNRLGDMLVEHCAQTNTTVADLAAKVAVTPKTLYEWIKGRPPVALAKRASLVHLAQLLGCSVDQIERWARVPSSRSDLEVGIRSRRTLNLAGAWSVFYVEEDKAKDEPYFYEEKLLVAHESAAMISGEYTGVAPYVRADGDVFLMQALIVDDMALGSYYSPARADLTGRGQFQVLFQDNGEFAQGFCTWLDRDSGRCAGSRTVWYRDDSISLESHRAHAMKILANEIEVFKLRARST